VAKITEQTKKLIIADYLTGKFSQRELEFASGKIAGIYDITNDKDSRDSASIKLRRE